jgi:hypothetical protein
MRTRLRALYQERVPAGKNEQGPAATQAFLASLATWNL